MGRSKRRIDSSGFVAVNANRIGSQPGRSRISARPPRRSATAPLCCSVRINGGWEMLSMVIGYATLAGSLLYKVPQVARVARHQRGDGISVSGLSLETLGTSLSGVYSTRSRFPFSTYGESLFIPVQNLAIMALVIFFERAPAKPWILWLLLYIICLVTLMLPGTSMTIVAFLNVCATPIMYVSKVPQLLLNFQTKSTGQLAPITLGLQLLGNVARIFTTIVQVRDPIVFLGFISAFFMNGALFLQWWIYRSSTAVPPA
ncbi:hypothetical protein NDN08_000383 [Rhodosorus marinus]|uniref:Mannose-P-dolichol utilization defect 1 protein homolog n=1 Tax=Rhodosorus marinus TaxID=101924 RepID=A0AAV8UMR3_9RHOD|nr:hypothetical protein NDN08_000383 [Rhodosorus marinus]